MKLPGEDAVRAFAAVLLVVIAIGVVTWVYRNGRNQADFGNVQAQLATTEESAGISRATADTVAGEQADTWAHAQADEGYIRERIIAQPRTTGPADPDILRIAWEAHARALCSAGRVHGTQCGNDATGAPGD